MRTEWYRDMRRAISFWYHLVIMMIRWFWTSDDMGFFSLCCLLSSSMKHSIEYIFLNFFFLLTFFSFCWGLIHFAMSGHIHSIQHVRFSQFDRLFGLVLLFSLQYLPIFFTSSFFILIQRQSILLPAQWPCIFFPWPYHMFTFLRSICSGFNSLCNDSLLLFQWNQTKSRFFFFKSFNYTFMLLHEFDHAISFNTRLLHTLFFWINSDFYFRAKTKNPQKKITIEKIGRMNEWMQKKSSKSAQTASRKSVTTRATINILVVTIIRFYSFIDLFVADLNIIIINVYVWLQCANRF